MVLSGTYSITCTPKNADTITSPRTTERCGDSTFTKCFYPVQLLLNEKQGEKTFIRFNILKFSGKDRSSRFANTPWILCKTNRSMHSAKFKTKTTLQALCTGDTQRMIFHVRIYHRIIEC